MRKTITLLLSLFFVMSISAQQLPVKNDKGLEKTSVSTRSMKGLFNDTDSKAETFYVKEVKVSKVSTDTDEAIISLSVDKSTGGFTYYQLLLDKDCEMYDNINSYYGSFGEYFYSSCEYSIPENAGPNQTNALKEGSETIYVPEGMYDLFLLSPDDMMIFVCEWDFNREQAMYKKFDFKAGYEYHFIVGLNDRVKVECVSDMELAELIIPQPSGDLTANEDIKMRVKNTGTGVCNSISLSYSINGEDAITETYDSPIAVGGEITYTFEAKANMYAGGVYVVEAWINDEKDLNPMNNYSQKITKQIKAFDLPFEENFEDATRLMLWTIKDNNNDEITWFYKNASYDQGPDLKPGFMSVSTPFYMELTGVADDYLILDPVKITTAGDHYMTFYTAFTNSGKESYEVLCGKSSNPSEMKVIASYPNNVGSTWIINVVNFEIDEPGDYHFAIHYNSTQNTDHTQTGYAMNIDQINIGEGWFVGIPDLVVKSAQVPAPACGLSAETELGLSLLNKGSEPITEFKLTYTINDASPVEETFTQTIGINETVEIFFKTKADLSKAGAYEINFAASTDNEENVYDNTAKVSTLHYSPLTALPFESNFEEEADRGDWNSAKPNAWSYNEYLGAYASSKELGVPLTSRCVSLAKGDYEITYVYIAGNLRYNIVSDFRVLYGKAGSDIESMTVLQEHKEENTFDAFVTSTVAFTVEEDDEYDFSFVFDGTDTWGGVFVKSVVVDKGDVAIDVVNSSELEIYPNPVYDNLTIKTDSSIESVKIYNMAGTLAHVNEQVNQKEYNLNVKDYGLAQGIYFVMIQTEEGLSASKIVVR